MGQNSRKSDRSEADRERSPRGGEGRRSREPRSQKAARPPPSLGEKDKRIADLEKGSANLKRTAERQEVLSERERNIREAGVRVVQGAAEVTQEIQKTRQAEKAVAQRVTAENTHEAEVWAQGNAVQHKVAESELQP